MGKGETLWRISRTYGVNHQELAEINNIRDPREIEAGRRLFIPGAARVLKVKPPHKPSEAQSHASPSNDKGHEEMREEKEREERIVTEKDRFVWPVGGEIISPYGVRGKIRHDGIDIKAEEGAPVKAAGDGKAVFVNSSLRGYGNIIILRHRDDFYTVYAHNKENLVKAGDEITKGDIIARVGSSGNASVCHLHFEVRQGKKVRNPLFFLP